MNLVLHPTSADRYVPSNTPKVKRRGTGASTTSANQRAARQNSAPPPTPTSSQYPPSNGTGMTPFMTPTSPAYGPQGFPFPPPPNPSGHESNTFQPIAPYGPPPEQPAWGYPPTTPVERPSPYAPPSGPPDSTNTSPISPASASTTTVAYNNTAPSNSGEGSWPIEGSAREDPDNVSYRTWPQEHSYSSMENNTVSHGPNPIDPSIRGPQPPPNNDMREGSNWSHGQEGYGQSRFSQEPYTSVPQQNNPTHQHPPPSQPPSQQIDTSMYASASYAQQQHQQQTQSQYHQGPYPPTPQETETPTSTIPPLPRHTYTRTLVGPLSANACRLLDEHRKPGIFFLFQDLSIRTEGTFRLRLRLMNVGAPPAPESGAVRVHTDVSPVLAQTFTEPFVVFSAKRFPGVPDTTALSIALGNQGQKLPLRNRNGTTKQGRKRQRSGSDGSGDESDET
ncbi:hypothetical protein NLI96_g5849 [Meripilus lineatus]|uniref:Velvet domain-containing protein n=1 Tax=Meripilus lineatus TaxID=2056292 RepID=A0AAD5V431_9APHY|nr:hypothetical protein NLI96_g5849 [Physisporinus lineatus]